MSISLALYVAFALLCPEVIDLQKSLFVAMRRIMRRAARLLRLLTVEACQRLNAWTSRKFDASPLELLCIPGAFFALYCFLWLVDAVQA